MRPRSRGRHLPIVSTLFFQTIERQQRQCSPFIVHTTINPYYLILKVVLIRNHLSDRPYPDKR